MKRLALLCALPFLLAADKWPQKGDTVYVAAELHEHYQGGLLSGGEPDVDLKACVPLRRSWNFKGLPCFKDDRSISHCLDGDWTAHLFKIAADCTSAVAARGTPRVISHGQVHRLADEH